MSQTLPPLPERLRDAARKLRTSSIPLADFIPLIQQAADAIEAQGVQDGDEDLLTIAYLHGFAKGKDAASAPPAPQSIPPELDVRKIMLSIEPDADGFSVEVYAKSVDDVRSLLGKMGEELEDWQLGIRRLPAPQAAGVQQEPVARLLTWRGPAHCPIPHGGVAARTFAEFPKDEADKPGSYWKNGENLYTHPAPQAKQPLTDEQKDAAVDAVLKKDMT